ncbi:MAG: hypothetical protein G8D81_06300 [gamma proteobacterium symbiont of Clathrolucina costata]
MDVILNSKQINLFSKLNITSFIAITLVACGGGGGDGAGEVAIDDASDINSESGITNTSGSYITTAAQVYFTQAGLGGIYAVEPHFAKFALYHEESGQKVTACDNSGEKSINVQKSGPEESLNPGDNLTVTYLHCDNGKGVQEGTSSIDIIENNEVSNMDFRAIYDSVSDKIIDGGPLIVNMRIKQEGLGDANIVGINSDRYEIDGSYKGNPNTIEHPAPHYEDDKARFSRMIIERYQNDSTNDTYLYWDLDLLNKENTAFSYTTTVLDDMKIINSVLSAGRYSVFYQGDRIEVTVAGPDIVQVILDENNDGSIEEQQQMTNDQFIAEALIVAQ